MSGLCWTDKQEREMKILAITAASRPASGRLGSAMARPGSSVGGGVRGVPGTASRLLETAARYS